MIVSWFIGYYLGKDKIVVNKKANKEDSKEILRLQQEMYEQQQEALKQYNEMFGGNQ